MCEAAPDPQEIVKKSEVIQAAPQKKNPTIIFTLYHLQMYL